MASLSDLTGLALVIVVVAIALSMGAIVLAEVQDEVLYLSTANRTETIANLTNATNNSLTEDNIEGIRYVATGDTNISDGTIAGTANYTLKPTGGNLFWIDNTTAGNPVNVSYSYYPDSIAYNNTGEGLDATDTTAGFLPIAAIVIIASVIIGVVATSFDGRGGL
jgi:hypothetical protein